MPLVISHRAKQTFHIRSEEVLGEILGHSNFDGEDWAIGDLIVFEDGTGAVIEKEAEFHVWSDPKPIQLQEVLSAIRSYGDARLPAGVRVDSFAQLFGALAPRPSFGVAVFTVIVAVANLCYGWSELSKYYRRTSQVAGAEKKEPIQLSETTRGK